MTVEPGWYVPTCGQLTPRWVLAVKDKSVLYATGGVDHRECQVATFRRWQRTTKAERKSLQ